MNEINKKLFLSINNLHFDNELIKNISVFFSEYLVFFFLAALTIMWFLKNNRYKHIALLACYSATLGIIINYVISIIYFHPRPFVLQLGNLLVEHSADASFPSDHTTFMLAISLAFMLAKETLIAGIIFYFLGLISGFSRIVCGLHFPFDIIGSIITAFIVILIIHVFQKKLIKLNDFIIKIWDLTISKFYKSK